MNIPMLSSLGTMKTYKHITTRNWSDDRPYRLPLSTNTIANSAYSAPQNIENSGTIKGRRGIVCHGRCQADNQFLSSHITSHITVPCDSIQRTLPLASHTLALLNFLQSKLGHLSKQFIHLYAAFMQSVQINTWHSLVSSAQQQQSCGVWTIVLT